MQKITHFIRCGQPYCGITSATVDRAIAASPSWLKPIWASLSAGVAVQIVAPGRYKIAKPPNDRGSIILVGDDNIGPKGSVGPKGYPPSLRAAIRKAQFAAMISCAPPAEVYAASAGFAVMGAHVVLVETTERYEADWIAFLDRHAPHAGRVNAIVRDDAGGLQ